LPAGGDVESEDELPVTLLALCVQPVAHHGERGISFTEALRLPDKTRSASGPLGEQAGVGAIRETDRNMPKG
jgi:hypothetical protein